MKSLIACFLTVVVMLSAAPTRSAEQENTPQEIENLAKELVRKLGNPDFLVREAASRELAILGLDAREAIEEGCEDPDLEIRYRCESLYSNLRVLDLKRRVELFAADQEGCIENTLPLGATFEKICGKDQNARKFFVELCKNHLQILDDAANNPAAIGDAYFSLTQEIEKRGNGGLPPGDCAAATEGIVMLLIGADEIIATSIEEANLKEPDRRHFQHLIDLLWQPEYQAAMIDSNNGRYFRKLLFAWAKRLNDPNATQAFLFFMRHMIETEAAKLQSDPDTFEFLMDFAVSTSAQQMPIQKVTAMAAVACISKTDQIPYIEENFFKDETTLLENLQFESNDQTTITVETRVCDYALAICVKLNGQSFKDYGFDILGSHSDRFNSWECAGFTNDETRKAAFKKYEEWRNANPIKKD